MAQVNYVREMEAFSDYAEANRLTVSERAVWTGLFHQFNARAFSSDWADGYIEINRGALAAACGLSKNTLLRAREKLAARGLIDFVIGGGAGMSRYKLNYLSVYGAPGGLAADPSHDGTTQSKFGTTTSHDGTTPSQIGTAKTGELITRENKPSVNVILNIEDEDIYNNKPTARAGERLEDDALGEAFQRLIGRKATPMEKHEIEEIAAWCQAEDALVCEALRRAAAAGAQAAGKYVTTCLVRWSDQEIRTLEELETWERLDELSRSTRPDIAAKGEEKLGAFMRELKIKHRTVTI